MSSTYSESGTQAENTTSTSALPTGEGYLTSNGALLASEEKLLTWKPDPHRSFLQGWLKELLSLLCSVVAFGAMIGILRHYDGSSVPKKPYKISVCHPPVIHNSGSERLTLRPAQYYCIYPRNYHESIDTVHSGSGH
jgi:hypothetical protein